MFSTIKELLGPCPKCRAASNQSKTRTHNFSKGITYRHYSSNHYDVLGVNRTASNEEIKAAFVKQSKLVHPDKSLHGDSASHDKFVRLNEAYMVLSKPNTRREYDVSMAAHWARQQEFRRHGYHSHSVGSNSMKPGSGFNNVESEERIFWDETLYHMRDKSKDGQYENRSYYGVGSVKKLPNSYIVYACIGLVFSGVILHFVALRDHGTALQLEILKSRVEEHPRSVFSPSNPPKE